MAAALAVFSYLYSAKSTNMMHALPVNRLELYVTNYLSGLIFLIVPEIITFFITVLAVSYTHLDVYKRQDHHRTVGRKNGFTAGLEHVFPGARQ